MDNIDNSNNRILYLDEHLAVFNKQNGEICESWTKTCTEPKTTYVPEAFLKCLDETHTVPKFYQCFNRLDRPVSGVNILVFSPHLFSLLQNQFTNNQNGKKSVKKIYWAIVEGKLPKSDFELLEHHLRFDAKKQKSFVHDKPDRKTKLARLKWRSLGHGENYSFVEIELLTGRTHQIRSQLAHIGLHIKGDVKYGARRQDTLAGIRLHARFVEFEHPKTHDTISCTADIAVIDPLWQAFLDCSV